MKEFPCAVGSHLERKFGWSFRITSNQGMTKTAVL